MTQHWLHVRYKVGKREKK